MRNLANLIAATALLLGYASAASADDVLCPDDLIGPIVDELFVVDGNVIVVGDCLIENVMVLGNVSFCPTHICTSTIP